MIQPLLPASYPAHAFGPGGGFLFNNVLVKLVGVHPETHIAFYVNNGHGGVIGVRVYPNGQKVLVNPDRVKYRGYGQSRGNNEYLQFRHAFGRGKGILASRAVYIAWIGPIPAGMTIDHINGCTTDNRFENLRCVSNAINSRDGGFLRKLKKAGFNPMCIDRAILLRYFDRMAKLKEQLTYTQYRYLSKSQLRAILYAPEFNCDPLSLSIFLSPTSKKIDMLDIH